MNRWGWMAEFESAEQLLAAARAARSAGYAAQAYAPFAIDGLPEALGIQRSRIPAFTFAGAAVGGAAAYAMQWASAVLLRPINVGGRPLHSWPMFIPVSFEMMILGGALAAVLAFFVSAGLPRLRHPVFAAEDFELASRHRFFLVLHRDDPHYEDRAAARWLDERRPLRRVEVPA